jgi:hypothetical protein
MQQRRALGQIERRAESDIVAADVEAQRDFAARDVRQELIKQVVF